MFSLCVTWGAWGNAAPEMQRYKYRYRNNFRTNDAGSGSGIIGKLGVRDALPKGLFTCLHVRMVPHELPATLLKFSRPTPCSSHVKDSGCLPCHKCLSFPQTPRPGRTSAYGRGPSLVSICTNHCLLAHLVHEDHSDSGSTPYYIIVPAILEFRVPGLFLQGTNRKALLRRLGRLSTILAGNQFPSRIPHR